MENKLIRLSKSCIGADEKKAVRGVLDREFLGMGEDVMQFEEALGDFFGRPVICVANGTSALHLALQAVGVGFGDEVLVPSLTYIASFQAIAATNATPIPCDISEENYLLDLNDAEKRITESTKAIMPVHYTGGADNLNRVYNFAEHHNLRVIEDAAHAFGTVFNNKLIGSFGDIACFSFDGIKNITSGEGGCIVTNDSEVIEKIKDARLLGVINDSKKRYTGERSYFFDVENIGWRYHMSNIMAAIGKEQLNRFDDFSLKRKRLAEKYDHILNNSSTVESLPRDYNHVVPHIYVVRIKNMANRELIRKRLLDKGIQTGIHYYPNHKLSFFSYEQILPLNVTERIFPELLTLPLHPDLEIEDVDFVLNSLDNAIKSK